MSTEHLQAQIVFATPIPDGVQLDCLLGSPGEPGDPVALTVRRAGQQAARALTGQLGRWAHDGTTVDLDIVEVAVGWRVRLAAGGTVMILDPAA